MVQKIQGGVPDWNLIERNTQPWNKLVSKNLCEKVGMNELLPIFSDSVYVDLLLHASKIYCLDEELYHYRVGHASESGSYRGKLNYYLEVNERAKKQEQFIADLTNKAELSEYFTYRYIYSLIQVCCVASVDKAEDIYNNSQKELKRLSYKSNQYTEKVLLKDYGRVKSWVLINLIPMNYTISSFICSKVF